MSTLSPEIAEKVARLLPRLASQFEPEVVNTVRDRQGYVVAIVCSRTAARALLREGAR